MSTLTNWLAINKRIDSLPPTFARSVAAWVRSFEQELESLDFMTIMENFQAHIQNYNNPHKVTLPQIESSMFTSLWNWYKTGMAPYLAPEDQIPTIEAFEEIIEENPIIWSQIMRDCILNNVYQYQDMVGYRYNQPYYLLSDTQIVRQTPPCYCANVFFPDFDMIYNNTLTSNDLQGNTGLPIYTVIFSFIPSSTTPWSLTLNTKNGKAYQSIATITYNPSTVDFSFSLSHQLWSVPPVFTNNTFSLTTSSTVPAEYRGVVQFKGNKFTFMWSNGGTFTIAESNPGILYSGTSNLFNFTLSHSFEDGYASDNPSTKSIMIYPILTSPAYSEITFSRS